MRILHFGHKQVLLGLALAGSAGLSGTAFAQSMASTPSAMSETQGATGGLGSSHRFPTQGAAASHCPGDTIVWASGGKLAYTLPASPSYGKGGGFYACKEEADDAGFKPGG